jgi:hypothetical protein
MKGGRKRRNDRRREFERHHPSSTNDLMKGKNLNGYFPITIEKVICIPEPKEKQTNRRHNSLQRLLFHKQEKAYTDELKPPTCNRDSGEKGNKKNTRYERPTSSGM